MRLARTFLAIALLASPIGARAEESDLGTGNASYYSKELAGRRTASGEVFDPQDLTAAHRTAPFGSMIKVTNLSNGREVVVRVNDRGPWGGSRIIDVSYAAARQIGLDRSGTARVRLTLVSR